MPEQITYLSASEVASLDAAAFLERRPKRGLLKKVGLTACVLASAATAAGAKPNQVSADPFPPAHAIGHVGFTTNEILVDDLNQAENTAQKIQDMNGNAVRIFMPVSPGQAEINNDERRLCNAMQAAHDHGLYPTISFFGFRGDGRVGYIPQTSSAITKFLAQVGDVMYNLSGPNSCIKDDDGNPDPLREYTVEGWNEVNNRQFWPQANAPARYYNFMRRFYPFVKNQAARITQSLSETPGWQDNPQPIKVIIDGAALSLTPNNNPLAFLEELESIEAKAPSELIMDNLSVHPYPYEGKTAGQVLAELYPKIEDIYQSKLGRQIHIDANEFGIITTPPPDKRYLYSGRLGRMAFRVSEAQQASQTRELLETASQLPLVDSVLAFQVSDEKDLYRGYQSGYFYQNGDPKNSEGPTALSFLDALNGKF